MRNLVFFIVCIFAALFVFALVGGLGGFLAGQPEIAGLYQYYHNALLGPGISKGELAPDDPIQTPIDPGAAKTWTFKNYVFTPRARYAITGRILHTKKYVVDPASTISPLDFALAWGRLSDMANCGQLYVGQKDRWMTYRWDDPPPLPEDEMATHLVNASLIPASDAVTAQLYQYRAGDVVKLQGYLVDVVGADGWLWTTAVPRPDVQQNASEVIWVDTAEKIGR